MLQLRYGLFIYFFNAFFVFISDFLKILGKYNHFFFWFNFFFLYLASLLFLFVAVVIFLVLPFRGYSLVLYSLFIIFFIVCMSFIPFPFSLFIHFSNWIFSYIGNIRSILLLISYELIFDFALLILFLFLYYYDLYLFFNIILFPWLLILYVVFLCDWSRVPFDLIEGESELVSGFNTELAFLSFLLVFFAEYILFFFFICLTWTISNLSILIMLFFYVYTRALLVRLFFIFILYLFWFYYLYLLTFYFSFIMLSLF